jgi:hypothetical protein
MYYNMNIYEYLPGASIGFTKILIGYPFETVKNNYQYRGKFKYNGILNIYKGCSIPLITSVFKRSIQLNIYEKNSKKNTYYGGFISGLFTSLLTNPFNVIKTNIQLNKKYKLHMLKNGNIINIFRDTIFTTYYLGTYGYIKNKLPDKTIYHSFSGIVSGSTVWILFSPFDYTRTLIYSGKDYKYIKNITFNNPLKMWNGCSYMIIKSIPLNILNMAIYEYLKKKLS